MWPHSDFHSDFQAVAAGQIDIADIYDIAKKTMSGMGFQAEELGNAIDVMTKAMPTASMDAL